jgi:hypothetical protein
MDFEEPRITATKSCSCMCWYSPHLNLNKEAKMDRQKKGPYLKKENKDDHATYL